MSSARVIPLPPPPVSGPPLAAGLLPRERLFQRLDAAGGCGVWLAAPAGYVSGPG
jgi:ATP/maltotriose-dependent transcriptional regulator MalT